MSKLKKKHKYKCGLCGKIKPYLFGFCACDECDKMLQKHIKYYREERKKIEREYREHESKRV